MKGFTILNNEILNDSNLTSYERLILIALKTFDHKRDRYFVKVK